MTNSDTRVPSAESLEESLEKPLEEPLQVPQPQEREPLHAAVRRAIELYLEQLEGYTPPPLYAMVMDEVERPLLETVLAHAKGNQTRAARYLGLSRTTLRNKLHRHGLADTAHGPAVRATTHTKKREG